VTLTAAPAAGSRFGGWGGACSGTESCTVTIDQDRAVTATFNQVLPPPVTCKVPNVVGKRLEVAKTLIKRAHCRTGKVGHAYSRKRTRGIVISQSRRPGLVLPVSTKINLVVSRGRKR
jgi:beta-lactam-binding protein with PASTA domain